MTEDRPDYLKAINTTLTPPEEDLKRPDEDIPPAPVPQVVPVAALDEDAAAQSDDERKNPDAGRADQPHPGTESRRSDA
jgi:hypothetical protein